MDYANDMTLLWFFQCISAPRLLCDSTVTGTNGNGDSYMTDAQPGTGDEMKVRGEGTKAARGATQELGEGRKQGRRVY